MLEKVEKPGRLTDFAIDVDACPLGLKVYCRSLSLHISLYVYLESNFIFLFFFKNSKTMSKTRFKFGQVDLVFSESDLRHFGRVFLSQASALRELEEAKSYVARRPNQ